jgi:hypothetical protein
MKKINKKLRVILLAILGLFVAGSVFAGSAHWSYPGAYGATGVNIETGPNAIVQSKKYGAANYQVNSSVQAGDKVAVLIYFHNDGDASAQNVTFRLSQPAGTSSSFSISGSVTESGGASASGTTDVNISSAQTLTYIPNSIRLYKNNQWVTPSPISGITDGSEIFNQGVNIGTIPGKNECPTDNPVCYQGSIAVGFQVSQVTSNVYQCSDRIDNDGDGLIDYPNDPGCSSPQDDSEFNTSVCHVSVYASPTNVSYGGYTTLTWNSTGGTNLTIDGVSYPLNGSGSFGPIYNSRSYQISLSGNGCSDTQSVYVSVNQVPPPSQCHVSVYATPTNVSSGGFTTLNWSSTGGTNLSIDGVSYPLNGSGNFGPLYSSRTYQVTLYGNNCSDSANAYVSVNQQQTYQCSDGYDNDGDGRIDYPNDPGCYSYQDNDEYNQTQVNVPSVITVPATNITRTSAQLNGIATNAGNYQTNLYFEWGRTTSLGNQTQSQTAFATADVTFFEVLSGLSPNTTYFFRAVAQNSTGTYKGEIKSFTTLGTPIITPTPIPVPPVVITRAVNLGLGTNLVQLKFQDQFGANGIQNVCVSNVATWTLYYKNISGNILNSVILHIDLPKDVAYRSSSGGVYNQADNSLTFNMGVLNIDQEGFITISGEILPSAADSGLLVMTATLSFENPINGARETAVAYGLLNAGICRSNVAGLALFGAGFWPTSLIGWLILILILLALIWVIRALVVPAVVVHRHKKDRPYYQDMDVPTAPYHA